MCQENPELRRLAEEYSSAVYQLGNTTDDLSVLSQKTVVDPMKKLVGEFPCIQAAVKRRDLVLQVNRYHGCEVQFQILYLVTDLAKFQ